MSKKIQRNYLEIHSINDLNASQKTFKDYSVKLVKPDDFHLNKFFYKNVGKRHHWVDRLIWTDKQWIDYVSDKKVKTYILKNKTDLAGYFELILHDDKNEIEIVRIYLDYLLLRQLHNYLYYLELAYRGKYLLNVRKIHLY